MRKKIVLGVLALAVTAGSVVPQLRAQITAPDAEAPFNCFGGYGGGCGVTWIKNCYC